MVRSFPAGILFLAGLACAPLGGCTSLPTPSEMLDYGFRSPEQCFRSFQYAVRADLPGEELRCFSQRFRAEHHVSQLVWREMREELWSQVGMRWAVAEAEPDQPAHVSGARASMQVSALGKTVRLRFVREECAQAWSGEKLLGDELVDFRTHTGAQEGGLFYGQVPLPPGTEAADVTEMRLAQEWKLDDIVPISPEN